ncbi:MAG: hypothetical protein WBX95_17015, partial [Xanthobacteraceae bacterium]
PGYTACTSNKRQKSGGARGFGNRANGRLCRLLRPANAAATKTAPKRDLTTAAIHRAAKPQIDGKPCEHSEAANSGQKGNTPNLSTGYQAVGHKSPGKFDCKVWLFCTSEATASFLFWGVQFIGMGAP